MPTDADKAAIMAVLEAETDAWMRRDIEALAKHWVHSPQTRRMVAFSSLGTYVDEGWDTISARLRNILAGNPKPYDSRERLRRENVNIVVSGDMAWVSYDQIGIGPADDDFELSGVQHELKIFHRVDGIWKISCLATMQRGVEHAVRPLIEVDPSGRIRWMNQPALDRISSHPGLIVANDRLRARRRACEAPLREAIRWAFAQLQDRLRIAARLPRLVQLGDDDTGRPHFCSVVIGDGKVLVTFDDMQMVARQIAAAQEAYGLSPAQARLARLITEGHDLSTAADRLGVSVNTLRTHLQRMFDRTGARNQAALVRALVSAEVPNK